jgi:hypothetical protein
MKEGAYLPSVFFLLLLHYFFSKIGRCYPSIFWGDMELKLPNRGRRDK